MHHANHFYGHAHIMARYVGLDYAPRMWGYLQHGWNMHDGFAVGTVFAKGYPKFVWSQACARRGWADGVRDYKVVASPWLYLLELEKQREWEASSPTRTGTIVYPFHGWEGQQVIGDHTAYVEEVKAAEGDVPITVCLHWNEFENDKIRAQYEDAGVRVITHGERGYLWKDTDTGFLYKQLDEMRAHKRVISNRIGSALLYAATTGAEVGIYGDPMALDADHAILGGIGKPRRLFPEMHQFAVPKEISLELALAELGADEMLSPEEIVDTFGWAGDLPGGVPQPPPGRPEIILDDRVKLKKHREHAVGLPSFADTEREMQAEVFGAMPEQRQAELAAADKTPSEAHGEPQTASADGDASSASTGVDSDEVPGQSGASLDVPGEGPADQA